MVPQLVNTGFQVLFHSPPGVLFTFPSQYCSSIGHWGVFRLGGWSPRLPTGFLVSRSTLDPVGGISISFTGLSPSLVCFPKTLQLSPFHTVYSPQPQKTLSPGLASFPFARRYLGNRCFFLLLLLLRCFSSQRLPSVCYGFTYRYLRSPQVCSPIRISPAHWLCAPPRSFSQLITSFFGSQCQGIHPVLFLA